MLDPHRHQLLFNPGQPLPHMLLLICHPLHQGAPLPSLDVAPTPSTSRVIDSHVDDLDHMTRFEEEFPSAADRSIIQPLSGG